MKITRIVSRVEHLPLARPYTIAFRTIEAVTCVLVKVHGERGLFGLGTASPEPFVTGETETAAQTALQEDALDWLLGHDVRQLPALCRELQRRLPQTPAARAALDMALHDLLAQHLGLPLVDMLGRVHERLPTSVTIGIKPVRETLEEAAEHIGRGFQVLKIKLGHSLDEDLERLRRLRERFGQTIGIRVDPNQGYDQADVLRFVECSADLAIEFLEQPLPAADTATLRILPEAVRSRVAADECLLDESDALGLLMPPRACGIFNIKLMKCGGVHPALRIAALAETAGIELMWGCMDESVIGISAALHAALSSPATHYLDLDGSFDLARDPAIGGFVLEEGCLRTTAAPGLGVRLL
ncbi:MAG: dipeptide epimerase [Gammaproteobacteria bacterium]|nr:dipeptide epimerase [Gammaproteobacteria bacterium]